MCYPVAQAFVGSNPTPRTNAVIQCSSEQAILDHAFYLKKEGYRESTIILTAKSLRGLARKSDLFNPEAAKVAIYPDCQDQRLGRRTPEGRSSPRQLGISSKLERMLNTLPRKENFVFGNG